MHCNYKPLILTFLNFITMCILLILYFNNIYSQNLFVIVTVIITIITVKNLLMFRMGLTLSYLIYLFLTHLSIPFVELFVNNPLSNLSVDTSWYFSSVKTKAVAVSS